MTRNIFAAALASVLLATSALAQPATTSPSATEAVPATAAPVPTHPITLNGAEVDKLWSYIASRPAGEVFDIMTLLRGAYVAQTPPTAGKTD